MAQITTVSKYALGALRLPEPQGPETLCVRLTHAVSANPGAGDVAWLADLSPGLMAVDFILDSARLDTNGSPTITISVGILNAGKTALATTWLSAATIAQNASTLIARPTTNLCVLGTYSTSAQSIGISFPATAATFAAGTVGLTLFYRAAHGQQ